MTTIIAALAMFAAFVWAQISANTANSRLSCHGDRMGGK